MSYEERIGRDSKGRTTRTHEFEFRFKSGTTETIRPGPLMHRALPELMTQLERRGLEVADHSEHGAFARIWDPVISRLPEDQQAAYEQYEHQLLEERLKGLAGTRWISGKFVLENAFNTVSLDFGADDVLVITQVRQSARPEVPEQQTEYRAQSTRHGTRFHWKFDDDSELTVTPKYQGADMLAFKPQPPTPEGKAALVAQLVQRFFRRAP